VWQLQNQDAQKPAGTLKSGWGIEADVYGGHWQSCLSSVGAWESSMLEFFTTSLQINFCVWYYQASSSALQLNQNYCISKLKIKEFEGRMHDDYFTAD
jgi:hypothetical protein